MSYYHSKSFWRAYVNEDNFGGGDGGAAYAETEPADSDALTADNYPINTVQSYVKKEYIHEAERVAGQSGDVVKTLTTGINIIPGKRIHRLQNATWIDRVIAYKDNEGAVPVGSWCEIFEKGDDLKAAYGCYITNYSMSVGAGNAALPQEEIEYRAYNVKDAANSFTIKPWSETTPKRKKDVVLTIGGTDFLVKSINLSIVPIWSEDPGSGQDEHKFVLFEGYESIEVEFTTEKFQTDMTDLESETATLHTVNITGFGEKTLTLNEMKFKNESINDFEQPESGLKIYSGTLEMGGDCDPSTT